MKEEKKEEKTQEWYQDEEFKQFMHEPDESKWPPVRPELKKAKLVFEHMMAAPEIDDSDESLKIYRVHQEELDKLIFENLNHETILNFALLCAETHVSARASTIADERLAKDKDGKQAAKQQVRECWEAWRKKPEQYKSKSAFARAMLDKYEELGSQRVIERWCKEWETVLS